jgi:hypothetical protein
MGLFTKAVKGESKLRLAIAGPSGSGKTYSALAIATALGGPIAYVDTEHGSASKYADLFDFDVAEMHAPYHPDKYVAAIREAAQAGYKVIVLDSLSHAWNGEGGLLELVEDAAKRMKTSNTYAAWKDVTPIQNRLIESIVSADIHLIGTMRSKQDYVQEKNDKGYTVIRKVGMAPVQRDGFEYEFDVFFDMDYDNNAIVSKSRCPALSGQVIAKPGAQVAKILKEWLGGTTAQDAPQQAQRSLAVDPYHEPRPTTQRATVEPDGDVIFQVDRPILPTDEELDILGTWQTPEDAQVWAVNTGACANKFEAKNSFKNEVNKAGGRLTKENLNAVLLAFLRKQMVKLDKVAA